MCIVCFFCFEQIKAEFMHPVQCCLFSLVTMTTMISGDVLYVWDFYLGELLIFLGVIVHLISWFLLLVDYGKAHNFCRKRYTRYITYRQLQGASLWQVH
ncbi:Tellurite resistance protein tehA homolog [Mannheimia haemolytica]|uniref:Tellurite resistance protein tehA homolog n=1 Tax=Mannheimia haemolytica TaxID=75985 RepID=A0A378N0C9_MANHA|nr:Tellurite resistance protein tehA homolog [Mannheimia haemolytica]